MSITPSRIASEVEYFVERDQAKIDDEQEGAYERRERAAERVTFDDVLEQLALIPDDKKEDLMRLWVNPGEKFVWKLSYVFAAAFEAAADVIAQEK